MQGNPVFMQRAIALATDNVVSGRGGPFGAVIVRNGEVISTGVNQVTANNDPTAHAEVMAIRNACARLGVSTTRIPSTPRCSPSSRAPTASRCICARIAATSRTAMSRCCAGSCRRA